MTEQKKPKKVLFVCSGNTCRSPMAQHLGEGMAEERGLEMKFSSRGLNARGDSRFGLGPAKDTYKAVKEIFPDSEIHLHEPTNLKFRDLDEADLVLTMEENMVEDILKETRDYMLLQDKVFTLREATGVYAKGDPLEVNIADPMGGGGYYSTSYSSHRSSHDDWTLITEIDDERAPVPAKVKPVPAKVKPKEPEIDPKYLECRNTIMQCLEVVLDGNMLPVEEIMKRRGDRAGIKIERETIKREIEPYDRLARSLNFAKKGTTEWVDGYVLDNLANPPADKPYLTDVIKEINELVAEKGIKMKPYEKSDDEGSNSKYSPKPMKPRKKPRDVDVKAIDSF